MRKNLNFLQNSILKSENYSVDASEPLPLKEYRFLLNTKDGSDL